MNFKVKIMQKKLEKRLEKRQDKLDGRLFQPKRKNQVFRQKSNRIKYHNLIKTYLRDEIGEVDYNLHKNYLLLKDLLGTSKVKTFKKEYLEGKGFTFGVHTGLSDQNGKVTPIIYKYLLDIDGDKIKVSML